MPYRSPRPPDGSGGYNRAAGRLQGLEPSDFRLDHHHCRHCRARSLRERLYEEPATLAGRQSMDPRVKPGDDEKNWQFS